MPSRGVAGFLGDTLVLTLPGSKNGVEVIFDALFPQILHLFNIKQGAETLTIAYQ